MNESSTTIPGWERPAWAVRGAKSDTDLTWERDSIVDVTYEEDIGAQETLAPRLFRVDTVHIDEGAVGVSIGAVRIRFADTATITPAQARKLADALVELAEYAEGEVRPD